MQIIDNLNEIVYLQDYYENLTKKEKSMFLKYLFGKLGMNPHTMIRKLKGNYRGPFRQIEIIAVRDAIESGLWRE